MKHTMPRQPPDTEKDPLNTPFRNLKKILTTDKPTQTTASKPKKSEKLPHNKSRPDVPDSDLFRKATDGIVPLADKQNSKLIRKAPVPAHKPGRKREKNEALGALRNLLSGVGALEVTETDEHLEGAIVGLDARVMRKLRAGEMTWQSNLDLHRMTVVEAQKEVRRFIMRALRAEHRCLLIVHGRGRNSPDGHSVLKEELRQWLSHGELAQVVLAFCTAQPRHGGSGATYVLLRRKLRAR